MIFCVGFPIWSARFLFLNREKVPRPEFKAKYDTLYQNINYHHSKALLFTTYFLVRRFFFAGAIIFLGPYIVIQVAIIDVISTLLLAYFICIQPMVDRVNNIIQVSNESVVLISQWLMFLFTDYVKDPKQRNDFAWYYLYFIAADVLANVAVLIYILIKKIYQAIRRAFLKKRLAKLAQ